MMANNSSTKSNMIEERLTQYWSVGLPRRLDPVTPQLADALADGAWTAAWRGVAAFTPLIALAVGFLSLEIWEMRQVYSESLLFMAVVIAGAILSGPVGVMIFFGFVLRTLLSTDVASSLEILFRRGGSLLIAYLLLAFLAVQIPQWGRRMAAEVTLRLPSHAAVRIGVQTVLFAVACGVLVYIWSQAMIVLIRPVFTWHGGMPTVAAIQQVQGNWEWLVGTAIVAALGRTILEETVALRSPRARVVADLREQRQTGANRRRGFWRQLPVLVRVGLATGLVTLLLAGVYESWFDPLLVAGVTAGLGAWRIGLIGTVPAGWGKIVHKIPTLLRFALVLVVGYLLANQILKLMWGTDSLRPILLGAVVTLVVFYLLFPPEPLVRLSEGSQTR